VVGVIYHGNHKQDCHNTKKARPKGLTLQCSPKGLTLQFLSKGMTLQFLSKGLTLQSPSKGMTLRYVHSEAARNQSFVSGRNYHLQLGGCSSHEFHSWEKDRPRAFLRFPRASLAEILRVCCHRLTTSEARGNSNQNKSRPDLKG